MRDIRRHIIHCSDSEFGNVDVIRQWHLERGFNDVGYHFVICNDGEIEVGRMLHEIGAHCKGHNFDSVGTCVIGKNDFNDLQMAALKRLHYGLCEMFGEVDAVPHNALNAFKTCPNFDVYEVLED